MPQRRARIVRLQRQRGASLLEAIAYLGVAAIVVLAAVSLLQGAFGGARSNQTMEEITGLRTAVQKMYVSQTYDDASMQNNLITAKAIPGTLAVAADKTIKNTWGGAVKVEKVDAASFKITYNSMPQDVCMNVVSGATGWTKIDDGGATNVVNAFPASAGDAAKVCALAVNTVVFTSN
jgi:type II secretory pathway pseudopilin PulG